MVADCLETHDPAFPGFDLNLSDKFGLAVADHASGTTELEVLELDLKNNL